MVMGKGALLSSTSTPPTCVSTLGYADDFTLTDNDNVAGTDRATSRATEITNDSRTAAEDMKVNIVKTKVLHVLPQESVTETTSNE